MGRSAFSRKGLEALPDLTAQGQTGGQRQEEEPADALPLRYAPRRAIISNTSDTVRPNVLAAGG